MSTRGSTTPSGRTFLELRKSPESGKWYARDEKGQTIRGATGCSTAQEAARRATAPRFEPSRHS